VVRRKREIGIDPKNWGEGFIYASLRGMGPLVQSSSFSLSSGRDWFVGSLFGYN